MGAQIAAGLLLMLAALVFALVSQRRAIRRDAAAVEHAETVLASLNAARLERERVTREQESDAAIDRALAKRAAPGSQPASTVEQSPVAVSTGKAPRAADQSSSDQPLSVDDAEADHQAGEIHALDINRIDAMSVTELNDLVKAIEKKFGVSAASMAAPAAAAGGATDAEERSEFNLVLTDAGTQKVLVIKAVREITGLGLKEAKDLVDGAPKAVKEGIAKGDAEAAAKKLVEAGAKVQLR